MTTIHVTMIIPILQKLGLKKEEAVIYQACLEFGALPASILSRKTGIPRTSIYVHTDKLIKRGFITAIKKGYGAYFSAIPPESLLNIFGQEQKKIQKQEAFLRENLPLLQNITRFSASVPQVTYYEGIPNLGKLYDNIRKTHTFYSYVNMESVNNVAPEYIKEVLDIIHNEHLEAKEILIDSPYSRKYLSKNKSAHHHIKLLPKSGIFHSDNIILDDRLFHISYNNIEGIVAVEIVNNTFVTTQRVIFETLWKLL